MVVNYRETHTAQIAEELKITKKDVDDILLNYFGYLETKLRIGETVRVLGICYIKNPESKTDVKETLSYIAKELSDVLGIGTETIKRVLNTLERNIIKGIVKGEAHNIRGLVRVRCIVDEAGEPHVRIKKSTKYNGDPKYIVTLNSFKRKVYKEFNSKKTLEERNAG